MDLNLWWRVAYKNALQTDLADVDAKGVSLAEFAELRDVEFAETVRLKRLNSTGHYSGLRPRSAVRKLVNIIYECSPALDVLAQSNFVFTLTWGVSRLLLQVVRNYYALSDKTASILRTVLSYIDIWKGQASLSESSLVVEKSIKALFHNLILLVGFAKYHSQQKFWKQPFRTLGSRRIEQCAEELYDSVGCVDRALRSAAEQLQHHHRSAFQKHLVDQALVCKSLQTSQRLLEKEIGRTATMTTSTHSILCSGGLVSQTSTWFNQDNWPQEPTDSLVPHTCEWLFKSPKWQSWIRQHSSKLLFVSGPAGCGKTCLAISALRELRMNSSNLVISYFFNSACGSTANNAQKLLASILVQIYRKVCNTPQEAPFKSFNQRYSHYSTVWDCKFCELLTFVENVLNSYPAYSLVIDSVDECQTHRQDLISLLSKLVKRNGVAIMATSRNTSSWPSCEYEALDLQSYPDLVRSDVTKFVEYQVDTRLPLNSPKYVASRLFVIKTVIDRCENNFLHAKLFIDLLQQQSTWGGMKKVLSDVGCSYATDLYKKLWETLTARLSCYPWKLDRCRCIFRLLIAAREPLSPEQIDYFLALDDTTEAGEPEDLSFDVIKEIGELCNPFICFSAQNYVTFFHTSAKDFIASQSGTAEDDANLYLARRCLSSLSRPMYRNPKKATELLRRHLMPSSNSGPDSNDLGISSIYNYAVLYFQDHITAITKPPKDLVLKLGRFLSGVEFVTWSESILDLKPGTGYAGQINVSSSLSKWAQTLDQNDREDINLDQYFEAAHILLALILQNDEDQILQFFPRIRLADYLNGAARGSSDLQRGYEQKQIVVEGLSAILPEDSAFLLKQKVALLQEYFWQKRFPEVLRELRVVYKMQKRVATEDDLYTTAWLIGVALVVLGSYEEAQIIISDTLEQIRKQRGEKYRFFNILLLLEGNRLERVNELHQAATVYRVALETVSEVAGPKNLFALILMTALGSVLRKQGKYKEAETRLFEGYAGRQPTLSIDFNVCLDAALQLATLYRDKGNGTECLELLGSVQNSIVFDEDFERRCQLIHIRNLVALDNGDYMTAKHELLEILQAASGTNRDKNNRELLWVRIDLADAMRQRSEPDEALMLFSDLVEEIHSSDVYGEPEPPSQLALAEQALRLVRKAEFAKSRRLLSENNLRWVREADFWFSYQGGPTLDTAVIAPVRM